jgi:drug/metabolite transporter (DMT)-like permease
VLGILFVILAGLLWAVDTLIRYPLLGQGISPGRIVFTEHLFLALIFLPMILKSYKEVWETKVSSFFYFFIIGVGGSAIGTLAFTKAFSLINPSLVILLQKLQPIIAITLAHFILGEKIKKEFLPWALLCLAGGVLISSQDIFPGIAHLDFSTTLFTDKSLQGYLLTLVAVACWAASTVFGKKLSMQGFDEIKIMGGRFVFGFIFMSFYVYSNHNSIAFDYNPAIWGKILVMVLLAGLGGMYFYYRGLKLISAHVCALAEMFFPLSAVAINWVFLGSKLTLIQMIGAGLLMIGSAIIQLKNY